MNRLQCKIKDYIQPFERELALQELRVLSNAEPTYLDGVGGDGASFVVTTAETKESLAGRLAYWESVSHEQDSVITLQSLREATVNVVRNGIDLTALEKALPFGEFVPLPNRRCLRYGTHGIHEYRGKFFPQLVRSLINISNTPAGGIVADPMSGSGTTAVEASLAGCRALGLDMNPLSVFLSRTKCELLSADPASLRAAYQNVRDSLLQPEVRATKTLDYFRSLPLEDQRYLEEWFAQDVLMGLDDIACRISDVKYKPARDLMWVSLSNILRSVSWQKDADLRVRKEIRLDVEIDPKRAFLEELGRSVRAVLAFLYQRTRTENLYQFSLGEGDARECDKAWEIYRGKVDTVITSPPYATALPYLDTDRLSLCYLGLLPRPEHRTRDQKMIGNREITERIKRQQWSQFLENGALLPPDVRALINNIEMLNEGTSAGFRRKNLPALLAKYFFDMREVLEGVRQLLKPGGVAFVVVGNNHTIAGGQRVDICTAKLLSQIAETLEFEISPSLSMEMLVSRDIFKNNAMESEEILAFRRPLC
ncbi:DNA methyltransferase [Burkholderia anthina]|uniref:DNA methyltransferase n=1 Tax=Burkholderia anthina TaxID=179879 RepID=UPI000A4DC9DD|nr:DNA methyltransferase [Burkholderia anthina]